MASFFTRGEAIEYEYAHGQRAQYISEPALKELRERAKNQYNNCILHRFIADKGIRLFRILIMLMRLTCRKQVAALGRRPVSLPMKKYECL